MKKNNSLLLFVMPAAVPLLLILFSFLKSGWGWTLVNDYQFLTLGTNFGERLHGLYFLFMDYGQLKWTQLLRYAFAYTAFANAPKYFFIYQWIEIVTMFGVWGMLAYRLTGKKIALFLMPTVVLSSRCFYDAFFFPSLGDNIAMLIFGLGLLALVHAVSLVKGNWKVSKRQLWLWALVFFFLALGAMEFTLAGIMAAGFALCWLYKVRRDQNRQILVAGIALVVAGFLYGLFLKTFIAHGSTSIYRITDIHKIFFNLSSWAKYVFKLQALWLLAGGVVLFKAWSKDYWSRYSLAERFGIVIGIFMYALWLAVLLPWSAYGYHAVPLVIVFGFLMAVILASPLEELDERWLGAIAMLMLVFNLMIAQQQVYNATLYNSEIQRTLYFIEGNSSLQQAAREGKVFCDQFEPSASLPYWANRQIGLDLKQFVFEEDPLIAAQKGAQYYVFMTWGNTLGIYLTSPGWEPLFVGEFIKVYQRRKL